VWLASLAASEEAGRAALLEELVHVARHVHVGLEVGVAAQIWARVEVQRRVRAAVGVEEGRGAHRDDKGLHEEDLGHCVLEVRGAMLVVLLCYLEHREVVED